MRLQGVDVGGLRIAYATAGAGPPLVLLHGGWGDHRHWRRQLESLSRDYAVAAWDAPGCGGSSDPPADWLMEDYADALAAWLAAARIERPHVVGLSWGGALALQLYGRHPHVPASLVLVGAYAGWAGSLPPEVVAERLARAEAECRRPAEEWAPAYIPSLLAEPASAGLADEMLAIMRDVRPTGTRAMLRAMAECDLRDLLPRIDVPVLLLYGERDVRSPLSVAEALHASIPRSQLVVLAGAGHVANVERPAEFDAAVRAFLG
jgi:pimeloyl-ACP methyl ester carboxylesterase